VSTRPTGDHVHVFVAPDGNGFMSDIASWIVEAAEQTGRTADLVTDRLPQDDGSTNLVVAPHEFYLLRDDPDSAVRAAARASVPVCTEQPGTPWFLLSLGFCVGSPLVIDINATGTAAIEREGFDAVRLHLGAVPSMDRRAPDRERDIDVLFLGGDTPVRGAKLATLAPALWDRRADIRVFSSSRPITGDEPGVVFGVDKYELLTRSQILVNLHRSDDDHGYFEWARMVEAMANGCVVVSEPSVGYEPLVPGVHFVETDDVAGSVAELLDDHDRLDTVARAAARSVLDEHPLAASLGPILDRLAASPAAPAPTRQQRRLAKRPIVRGHAPPLMPPFTPDRDLRLRTYRALMAETRLQRDIDALRCRLRHGDADHVERTVTPAYPDAGPEVSVVVTLFDYAHLVTETLDSLVASRDVDMEIVVVDDHSRDDGRHVVRAFMDAHPDVAMLLLGRNANRGLPAARNLGFEHARADRVMVMDADNLVYPTCLRRLSDALDDDAGAALAYATLEAFGERAGLASAMGWHVPWLCERNYIDAQAMLRRSTWERHGGYRDGDELVFGWEDWEFWLRLAEAGEYGVHVPEMLGRYRTQVASMISVTNLAAPAMLDHLRELHPSLPWP